MPTTNKISFQRQYIYDKAHIHNYFLIQQRRLDSLQFLGTSFKEKLHSFVMEFCFPFLCKFVFTCFTYL